MIPNRADSCLRCVSAKNTDLYPPFLKEAYKEVNGNSVGQCVSLVNDPTACGYTDLGTLKVGIVVN